jgi:hypothetical protein
MFSTMLALSLAAAPIPKSVYEGQIGVVVTSPKAELIVFSPSGSVEKRIALDDLGERVYTVKMGRDGKTALLTTYGQNNLRIGNRAYVSNNGYLIDLTGTAKPKRLFENKGSLGWVINRDCTKAYGGYIDEEKAAKGNPADPLPFANWCLDLKTGTTKPIELPTEHRIADITADDQTVLTMVLTGGKYRAGTAPVSTWKPELIPDGTFYPHGISPDGRKMLTSEYEYAENNQLVSYNLKIYDFESKGRRQINRPEDCQALSAYSYGADGKRICFIGQYRNANNPNGVSYKLFTCSTDGSNQKMIYEAKPGEMLSDCDWR